MAREGARMAARSTEHGDEGHAVHQSDIRAEVRNAGGEVEI
jgi:hypothetical protein